MLSSSLKQVIQDAYRAFLNSKQLRPRYGQKLMIADIAKTIGEIEEDDEGQRVGEPAVCVVEAGTGTGKTVAYALAMIPIAQEYEKQLVIATATVALQEQILFKDLPDIRQNSGLSFSFALAKGRGRYVCLSKLDNILHDGASTLVTQDLFVAAGLLNTDQPHDRQTYQTMLDKFASSRWDGDRDSWPDVVEDKTWQLVATDHVQCSNRRCTYFHQCAFFKARERLGEADVIVTNHDMVLADLALGGGAVLPAPSKTLYVFDEGHHLPDKALNHFNHNSKIHSTRAWLEQLPKSLLQMRDHEVIERASAEKFIPRVEQACEQLRQDLLIWQQQIMPLLPSKDEQVIPQYRFAHGVLPDALRESAGIIKTQFALLVDILGRVSEQIKQLLDQKNYIIPQHELENWYALAGVLLLRAEANFDLWTVYSVEDDAEAPPNARWVTWHGQGGQTDLELSCSPILAAKTLRQNLWNRCFGAVVTSATLTALGQFDRFKMRAGVTDSTHFVVVPSPLPYQAAARLVIPSMPCTPKDPELHTAFIIDYLPELLSTQLGSLVLFASRRQMEDVYAEMSGAWQDKILMQGELSKQEIIVRHKKRIDQQQASVIFGLASFAEGIDLPGVYCEHVIIAKIPFAAPDNPVEAGLAEWIEQRGGNPFMQVTVPDAATKLVQACGRLLRHEKDQGIITLLDRRIVTQRYGKAILSSLPPFQQEIQPA
ncbi:ATP-dependent DNA helicase DinG [Zooshikella marina]|uniref:ATP-dependent DNA helicase DinG n=1 Tax=Zooshikella ganghwensis TaxID=202772 RepID=UPI001BAF7610|nr:ATP-dependent DNA helicase DinG [Zooshikella ganghwensis]MBU2704858.1 ATP-dependent DNA helicase DinG [Zooshikella ganghwensis]